MSECRGRRVVTLIAGEVGTGGDPLQGLPAVQNLSREVVLPSGGDAYSLTVTRTEDSDSTGATQDYVATVSRDGVVTELRLDVAETEAGEQTGTGTISHDGETRVRITVDGSDYVYGDVDGNQLSTADQIHVDDLVRSLFLTGFNVFFNLPLLFLTS